MSVVADAEVYHVERTRQLGLVKSQRVDLQEVRMDRDVVEQGAA